MGIARSWGEISAITGETVIDDGTHVAIFSILSLEPLDGRGIASSTTMVGAKDLLMKLRAARGVGIRHYMTEPVLDANDRS